MKKISLIIPAYNEGENIPLLYEKLQPIIQQYQCQYTFELLFVDDGSTDDTLKNIQSLASKNPQVSFISFSRNFGKEFATTAGLNHCTSDACIMLDADLQHPVELIPQFIKKWEQGFETIIGVRNKNRSDSWVKKQGSRIFYRILKYISDTPVIPNATDFRLVDHVVISEFNRLSEKQRMTRALIDWLGFRRALIYFDANERVHGTASYSLWKLVILAINGFISLSLLPLKLTAYLGIFITTVSFVGGLYIFLGKYVFNWHFAATFSDAENLAIFIVFLVGIILISLGLIAYYIASIHQEVIRRPLYVIRHKKLDSSS